ncbi:hypothetical protein CLAVI_000992 [Candidatus Clavichlamydia salmonicola]|uniref:hypothetical protein n=1 Tax=Candidatus Clavichlamydia salmonicola TaxID=469812 RepID=UPI0018910E58|nr:hypothetical protein [Candidatus Clavichlamydia salmonicola]MBF5051349.1 hypothetical protein [Candidatus Clavichlamydia salmonicola]
MTGLGNGFSSGIQSLNDKLFLHTGRRCPSSWKELKTNVSKNVTTCAKMCSAFLDSSLGMAISIGVLGLATASVCMQEDFIEVVATTLFPATTPALPLTTAIPIEDKVAFCFSGKDHMKANNLTKISSWVGSKIGTGKNKTALTDSEEADKIFCVEVVSYRSQFPSQELPKCSSFSNPELSSWVPYYFISWGDGFWNVSSSVRCVMQSLHASKINLDAVLFPPKNTLVDPCERGSSDAVADPYCFKDTDNTVKQAPLYFLDPSWCNISSQLTTMTSVTTSSIFPTIIPVDTNNCTACDSMTLAFGVGSLVILTATLTKLIYKQCKKSSKIKCKNPSNRLCKILILTMQEGLLLVASKVGFGVFISSVKDICKPISENNRQMLVISTALYLSSATIRLIGTCITSPIEEDQEPEEVVGIDLPMLKGLKSTGITSVTIDDGEEEGLTTSVVMDNPEIHSTSKSCCC